MGSPQSVIFNLRFALNLLVAAIFIVYCGIRGTRYFVQHS